MTGCQICEPLSLSTCAEFVPSFACLRIAKGTDFMFEAVLTDAENEPVDLTLDTVIFTVWNYLGGTKKIQKTNAPGAHEDPTNGRTRFHIQASDISEAQGSDSLYWQFEIRRVDSIGHIAVHILGDFVVEPQLGV